MLAGGQEGIGDGEMRDGGSDDAKGIRPGQGAVEGGKNRHAVFFGDFGGVLRGGILHAGKFDQAGGGETGVDAGMFLAEGTHPDHRHFKLG